MKSFCFALCVVLLGSGCASTMHMHTGNKDLTESNVEKIKKGMTKDEVFAILGKPFSKSDAQPLGEFWSYMSSDIKQTHSLNPLAPTQLDGVSKGVTIVFDEAGVVKNISKSENDLFQPMTVTFT